LARRFPLKLRLIRRQGEIFAFGSAGKNPTMQQLGAASAAAFVGK
jgi:hypothetical protein